MAHAFNPTLEGQRQVDLSQLEASLVIESSRTARNTYKDPVSKQSKQVKT